ncbi:MAG: SdpI family protein [Caulobacterales bacterium]|nr:SdpI family protein [Caulobacterales bacterium]
MKRANLLDRLTGVATAALISFGAWIALAGPQGPLPVHYNAAGEVDRWGGRIEVGALVAGLGLLTAVVAGLTGLAVARSDDQARRRGLMAAQAVTLIATVGAGIMIAALSLSGAPQLQPAWPMALVSLLMLAIGTTAGRVGPNPAVGLRTPWNYKSRLAWDRSNRLAGRLFFWLGLIGLAAAPFAPQPLGLYVLTAAILIAVAVAVFESWRVWRDDPERQPF